MNRNEFDKLEILQQIEYINKFLSEGKSLTSIAEALEVSRSTIRKRFQKIDYVFNKESNQYIKSGKMNRKFFDDTSKTSVIKEVKNSIDDASHTNVIKKTDDISQSLVINNKLKEDIVDLAESHDEIMQMLKWFKKSDRDRTNIIEIVEQGIKIDLPQETETNYRTTVRINNVVWENFKEFTQQHSEYTSKDLLSQSLVEYMEKHR